MNPSVAATECYFSELAHRLHRSLFRIFDMAITGTNHSVHDLLQIPGPLGHSVEVGYL